MTAPYTISLIQFVLEGGGPVDRNDVAHAKTIARSPLAAIEDLEAGKNNEQTRLRVRKGVLKLSRLAAPVLAHAK